MPSVLNVKVVVAAFNKEKALVGAFSVIVKTGCGTDGSFYSTSYNLIIPPLLCLVSALCFEAELSFILILWGKFIHFTTVLYSFGSDKFSYGYDERQI